MILSQLGLVATRAGNLRVALESLAAVPIEGPEDFNTHYHIALAALRAGNEAQARWFMTKAFERYFIGSFEDSWTRLWHIIQSDAFLSAASSPSNNGLAAANLPH